ncbi:MAG: hypothetical protein K2M78_03945 [Lachnospiraceae bacterium]|nr:hypothetical protein [Lachnospiraceae bacterium]
MEHDKEAGRLNVELTSQTEDVTVNINDLKARLFDELYELFIEGDADDTDIAIRLADYKHVMDIMKCPAGTEV